MHSVVDCRRRRTTRNQHPIMLSSEKQTPNTALSLGAAAPQTSRLVLGRLPTPHTPQRRIRTTSSIRTGRIASRTHSRSAGCLENGLRGPLYAVGVLFAGAFTGSGTPAERVYQFSGESRCKYRCFGFKRCTTALGGRSPGIPQTYPPAEHKT